MSVSVGKSGGGVTAALVAFSLGKAERTPPGHAPRGWQAPASFTSAVRSVTMVPAMVFRVPRLGALRGDAVALGSWSGCFRRAARATRWGGMTVRCAAKRGKGRPARSQAVVCPLLPAGAPRAWRWLTVLVSKWCRCICIHVHWEFSLLIKSMRTQCRNMHSMRSGE